LLSWRGSGAASSFNGRGLVIEQVARHCDTEVRKPPAPSV
jgi:hypothetical protein